MNGIITEDSIFSKLAGKNVVLDTCCLVHGSKLPNLIGKFFKDIKQHDGSFFTIPIVNLEFLRGVESITDYEKRHRFLIEITDGLTFPIEKKLDDIPEFPIVMRNIQSKVDLADYLLVACLVSHPEVFLLTENHHHMPMAILDRVSIISFDNDKDIKTLGLYQLNQSKYDKVAKNILAK